jgi:hypothetical protein
MADYARPRQRGDIDPSAIKQKVLELAVPEYTSNAQREQLSAAMDYGRRRGVLVMITVVADDPLVVAPARRQALPSLSVRASPPTQPAAVIATNRAIEHNEGRSRKR